MKFDILNRLTGSVVFSAEIECKDDAPTSVNLGLAVKMAIKSSADLSSADLYGANLSSADLSSADLSSANNAVLAFARTSIVPQVGAFVGWKRLRDSDDGKVLARIQITETSKRSNASGRKCRCSEAVVLEIIGAEIGYSRHDRSFEYRVGATVTPREAFDENRWEECASGIHFFLTREEAEDYS